MARTSALTFLFVGGFILVVATPFLLLLGAWAGSDSGSVVRGIANILGVPWVIYLVCAAISVALLRRRHYVTACVPAIVPVAIMVWLYASAHWR